ncbi:MAG: tetratricopeptide repeat protein [Candidatus Obscuribacterales bacterium]|nr:tetratricopeptide repeat protein [Candidatus Obscuribacterales bacterium]
MVKITRKTGIAIAVIGLLCVGGIANSIKKIKFENLKSVLDVGVTPMQEFGGIMLNTNALLQAAQFEYQFLLGDFYSHRHRYEKALACYDKAILCAKESFGAQSFFTSFAYRYRGQLQKENSKYREAHDDFKASLEALPNRAEYDIPKCKTEFALISTGDARTAKKNIPFYREHLALTEKLANTVLDRGQLIYSLWILGRALDDGQQYAESEPIWNKMISEARAANYPSVQFEPWLLEFANHEMAAEHYPETERALWEALRIAAQATDDRTAADILEAKADLRLRQNELEKAENNLQTALTLRKKFNDDLKLSITYGGLSEVARRRGDLTKREEYLKVKLALTEAPEEKTRTLKSLALIAAQNNRPSQAKEYVDQWKQLAKTNQTDDTFVFEKDLKKLLALYPQLNSDGDFSKLQSQKVGPHRHGYYLSTEQLSRLMNAISASKQVVSKK